MSLNKSKKEKLCIRCQACCKLLYIPTTQPLIKEESDGSEFYKERGIKFCVLYGVLYAAIPSECPQLTKEGCKIYSRRPQSCQEYDGRKDPLMKDICLWRK